jgi:hypothetical protein
MNLRLILPATAAILGLATSCTPYKEEPPPAPADPAARTRTPEEEEKIRTQRAQAKKEAEERERAEEEKKESGGNPDEMVEKDPAAGGGGGPAKPPEPKTEIQVARPVPGKPGFVFSPFNNKVIDVKGIPSGRLVADPTYPASEKKHFRVP